MTAKKTNPVEVSIVVPCYNEEKTIRLLLEAIRQQDYPIEKMEVVISDALSEDDTRLQIAEYARLHSALAVRIIDNVQRTIPAAVNSAVENAQGEFIVRMDAHSVPNREYVRHSIDLLKSNTAQNVGGVWEIEPGAQGCMAAAIARAAAHPLGAGDASYRIHSRSGFVDTVPFGAFRRDEFMRLGKLNEGMLANEDYEFNTRLRASGGKIWLDTRIRTKYFARKNLKDLARQYWRYGFWKLKMLKKFPGSLRWRQAIPPVFVLFLLTFGMLSLLNSIALIIFMSVIGVYISTLLLASAYESLRGKNVCYLLMIFAFMTMHLSWGSGFLLSFFRK